MKIGVIADDFTGATDAASFAVKNGLNAVQLIGVPERTLHIPEADVLVISLKTRSCPADEAVRLSLQASEWLTQNGCELVYFKYCSTFDSTSNGNIGPVIDALKEQLNTPSTLICPALPINGRTVYQGYLFVFDKLLNESGMQNHPITPMQDANLLRLIEAQSKGRAGLLNFVDLQAGPAYCTSKIKQLTSEHYDYVVCDSLTEQDLSVLAESAVQLKMPLLTGGSGLLGGLAQVLNRDNPISNCGKVPYKTGKGVVLSGSCSLMTNKQVEHYKNLAPGYKINIADCFNNADYVDEIFQWVESHSDNTFFPMVYATVPVDELKEIQRQYGDSASVKVEEIFHYLVKKLKTVGYQVIISAGGETSGTVTQALELTTFSIGKEISPGVPWVFSLNNETALALKSGNFGQEDFFQKAQEMML